MAAVRQATAPAQREAGATEAASLLLDGRFRILPGTPVAALAGHACFAAEDRRGIAGNVVALRADPAAPPRATLPLFMAAHHDAMLCPLAYGAAGGSYWIITTAPPGPPLTALVSPWSGNGLLTHVLRPAALALDQLQMSGLTHRAIRPDNLFVAAGGKNTLLGPGWAGPPAMHQPASFEPPYSAICAPTARGNGSIADDVYSLGVLLLSLWTGRVPLAELEPAEIIRLKLEYGSFAALAGQTRLQRGFEEILRAMLSDDPVARPTPASLAMLDGIHARRGGSRSTLRAIRPIAVGTELAWNRRSLALLCANQPEQAMALLRDRSIEQWLRRSAEDATLAGIVEDFRQEDLLGDVHGGAPRTPSGAPLLGDIGLMRLIALLDPLAPLFWRGRFLWPDGLGPLLAGSLAQPSLAADAALLVSQLVLRGGIARWRQARGERPESNELGLPPRLLQSPEQDDRQAFLLRIVYALNPYLACASPRLAGEAVVDTATMVALLEKRAEKQDGTKAEAESLLDLHSLAFLDARTEGRAGNAGGGDPVAQELSMLARCQTLTEHKPLPRIAASLLPRLERTLEDWPGISRRRRRLEELRGLAAAGDLVAMLHLFTDTQHRVADDAARERALVEVEHIRADLAEQARTMSARLQVSRHAARDTASAAGLLCVMGVLLLKLLS